jgi:hypothetical protein
MPSSDRHARAVHAAIEGFGGTLAVARALAAGGRHIDLSGLDREAAALCAAVMALEQEAARALRPALEALLRQLDGLNTELAQG